MRPERTLSPGHCALNRDCPGQTGTFGQLVLTTSESDDRLQGQSMVAEQHSVVD